MGKRDRRRQFPRYRQSLGRKEKEVIWIVGEGVTEKMYFEAMRRALRIPGSLAEIKVYEGGGGSAEGVLARAKKELRDHGLSPGVDVNRIWLVYDCEPHDPNKSKVSRAVFHKTKTERYYEACVSHPCMELWFLLHFAQCPPAKELATPALVQRHLKKYLPSYKKGHKETFLKINKHLKEAKERASKLWGGNFPERPATGAHLLIEALEALGS